MPTPTIAHLERRKIEGGVLIPMVQAFQRAIGKERANEIAREVIIELARRDGERWRRSCGEFYKELGLPELGQLFHCNRDFAMVEGFSPSLTLKRTQTIMEGESHCDFRFKRKG